jgi:hypothetical protein
MWTVAVRLVPARDDRPGDADRGHPTEYVAVGQVLMEAPERVFGVPTMAHTVGADFNDVLRLLGYDLNVTPDALHLVLHWQALQRMDKSYKIFVHLQAVGSDELVAQRDVVPRDWTYPTTWWEEGEVVSDEMELLLEEVPPGEYRLWVGVYQPLTGERLPISDPGPEFDAVQGRLMLPDRIAR